MNILQYFFYKIAAKDTPERIKLHNLKKNSRESIQVASPRSAWHKALCK